MDKSRTVNIAKRYQVTHLYREVNLWSTRTLQSIPLVFAKPSDLRIHFHMVRRENGTG